MNQKIIDKANEIVDKISNIPKDTTFFLGEYFSDLDFSFEETFALLKEINKLCEERNIILENPYPDQLTGMPWAIMLQKKN